MSKKRARPGRPRGTPKPGTPARPLSPIVEVPDFQVGQINRPLWDSESKTWVSIPFALAAAQAEYLVVVRVEDTVLVTAGATQVTCSQCGKLCWRALSSPKRPKVICTACLNRVCPSNPLQMS